MSTIESTHDQAMAELEAAVQQALSGKRDREAMRKAGERMDALREKNREKFGIQEVAVELIRDARR